MAQYRKKPVVIEAWQSGSSEPVPDWMSGKAVREETGDYLIETLEGVMRASPGDWIIRGVNGEVYPCKPDIFAKTYEAA